MCIRDRTYAPVPTATVDLKQEILDHLPPALPVTGNKGFVLADVAEGSVNLDDFVAQLSTTEMELLSRGEGMMDSPLGASGNAGAMAGVSDSLRQKGIPPVITTDGPSGIRLRATCSLLPSGTALACSWNLPLVQDLYAAMGREMVDKGTDVLLAPGMNIHRNPLCGRNFEYYSEDPFVAGTICAAEVQGIQSKGVYVYLKHVALNDSETSRRGVNTWLNEQAAREIYLEVADKAITDGGAWSVMTGFNRWGATWCGANANLLTGFLRGELGMRGMCITDFSGSSQYMDLVDGLIAGSDIWDSPMPKIHTTKAANYENDAYIVTQMRNAMHHILYTVVNSNAMNGWASTDTLKTITPWWQTAIYALIAVLAVLTILCAWQLSKALKAKKSMVDTAPAADRK